MPAAAYWLPASDETPLYTRHWPSATAVGAVMLSHGMAEHAGRYERLAAALNAAGYHFYAATAGPPKPTSWATSPTRAAGARWSATWPA